MRYRRCRIPFLFPAASYYSHSRLPCGNTSLSLSHFHPFRPGEVGGRRRPPTIDHHLAHASSFRFSQWKPHETFAASKTALFVGRTGYSREGTRVYLRDPLGKHTTRSSRRWLAPFRILDGRFTCAKCSEKRFLRIIRLLLCGNYYCGYAAGATNRRAVLVLFCLRNQSR